MYTVYIVDDDKVILDEIVNTVPWLDNGFSVIGYSTSSVIAIKEIASFRPDAVFSDLKMPAIGGIDMMKQLIQCGCECEFIMLSAYGTFEDSRNFFLSNGFDYILKPLNLQEVQLVLERLAKKLSAKTPKDASEAYSQNAAFSELVMYLEENFNKRHTLDDLGKRFNLNPKYVCSLFSKHLNSTLTQYVTVLRMEQALLQMRKTDKAYKEIAIDCGYTDYFYFCRVFKEYFGASPTIHLKNIEK